MALVDQFIIIVCVIDLLSTLVNRVEIPEVLSSNVIPAGYAVAG